MYDAGHHLNGIGALYTMCMHSHHHEVLTRAEWILATLAQHLTDVGSVSASNCRQQYALPDQRAIERSPANTRR